MNRREFIKKSLGGIVIISVPLVFCGKNPIKSNIEEMDIIDLTTEQNITYFLTGENDVYRIISLNKAELIKKNDIKIYYKLKLKELFTDIVSERIEKGHYSHLCRDDTLCYGIILAGWSSRFVIIDPITGEEKFLRYLQGEPAGLFISNKKLWYLSNRRNDTSLLLSYNKNSGENIDAFITPLHNAAGLSIDDGFNFTTYEKMSNSFVSFKIVNNEIKLLVI